MEALGIRFCAVSKHAEDLAKLLGDGLGLTQKSTSEIVDSKTLRGSVFEAGSSWIEVWPESDQMPSGVMLQIVVDNADAWAERARNNGVELVGPMDINNERAYYLEGPGSMPITFQSAIHNAETG